MVATTPQPRINLESLFDSNDNINHRFRFIVDGNNHRFRFIIVECYVSNRKPHRTPCRQNLPPFLVFACVGEVDGDADFAAGASGEGRGGSAISVARWGPPGREGAPEF